MPFKFAGQVLLTATADVRSSPGQAMQCCNTGCAQPSQPSAAYCNSRYTQLTWPSYAVLQHRTCTAQPSNRCLLQQQMWTDQPAKHCLLQQQMCTDQPAKHCLLQQQMWAAQLAKHCILSLLTPFISKVDFNNKPYCTSRFKILYCQNINCHHLVTSICWPHRSDRFITSHSNTEI